MKRKLYYIIIFSVLSTHLSFGTKHVKDNTGVFESQSNTFIKENHNIANTDSLIIQIDTTGINGALDGLILLFRAEENLKIRFPDGYPDDYYSRRKKNTISGLYVSIRYDDNGKKKYKEYKNSFIGLKYIKEYENGTLTECGFTAGQTKLGVWKYYSDKGKLDTLINYETNRSISFLDFFDIARKFGMVGKGSKLPSRETIVQLAREESLIISIPRVVLAKVGWPSLDIINQENIIKAGNYSTSFGLWNSNGYDMWNVQKEIYDGKKRYIFYLSLDCKERKIYLSEYSKLKI